jgi:hypothetical protein
MEHWKRLDVPRFHEISGASFFLEPMERWSLMSATNGGRWSGSLLTKCTGCSSSCGCLRGHVDRAHGGTASGSLLARL